MKIHEPIRKDIFKKRSGIVIDMQKVDIPMHSIGKSKSLI